MLQQFLTPSIADPLESVAVPGLSGRCQSPCRALATSLQPRERQETSGNHCTTIY